MNARIQGRIKDLLSDFPITFETPVAWGEMDAFQHVNNIVSFRYFESARIAYFRAIGFYDTTEDQAIGPILAATSCRYRRPITYPDRITIGARVDIDSVGDDRFTMHYQAISHHQLAVVSEGDGRIVSYDYEKKQKAPLPDAVREAILKLEAA